MVRRASLLAHLEVRVHERTAELAQSNASLRLNEVELKEAQRLAKVGSWQLLGDTVIWSEEMHRIFGHDPKLPPTPFSEHVKIYTPESWVRLQGVIQIAIKSGIPYELDLEVVCPDGIHKWITARGEALCDEKGLITSLRGTVQDITERKRTEQAVRVSELRYRRLFEAARDGILILDADTGRITDVEPFPA